MPLTHQVAEIVNKVNARLAEAERTGVYLKVAGQKLEDDWLYVVVVPSRPGVRASDHALLMTQIERELRTQGDDRVLLVPAIDD